MAALGTAGFALNEALESRKQCCARVRCVMDERYGAALESRKQCCAKQADGGDRWNKQTHRLPSVSFGRLKFSNATGRVVFTC